MYKRIIDILSDLKNIKFCFCQVFDHKRMIFIDSKGKIKKIS
jgi:hypothetical protein